MNFYYFKIKDREAISSMSTRQLKATHEMMSHHYSFSCHGKHYHVKNYVHIHQIYCLEKNICNPRFLFAYSLNCRCFNTLLNNLFSLSHLFISILIILHVFFLINIDVWVRLRLTNSIYPEINYHINF